MERGAPTRRSFLAGGGLAALGLSGCGAGSRIPASQAVKVPCSVPQPDSAAIINVLAYNSSAIDPFTNTMVRSCSQGRLTLRHEPIDFAGQLQRTQATLGGDRGTYDIVETYGFVIPEYGANGSIARLDDLFAKHRERYALDGLDATMREALSFGGHLYGMPMQAQMHLMAYRTDIFDGLQLSPPTTFEELRAVAAAVRDRGGMEHPLALPLLASADIGTAYDMALGSLGRDMTDAATKKANFDTPEAHVAFEELLSLKEFMDPQVTTFDQPTVQQQMYNGSAAMAVMFSGRMNDLTQEINTRLYRSFGFAPPPAVRAGGKAFGSLSVDGWSIPSNARTDPDTLFQIIAASLAEPASKAAIPAAYPARSGLVTDDSGPYAAAANATLPTLPPAEIHPGTAAVTIAITPTIAGVFLGRLGIEQGLETMQKAATAILEDQ